VTSRFSRGACARYPQCRLYLSARTYRREDFIRTEFFAGRDRHLLVRGRSESGLCPDDGASFHYFYKFGVWRRVEGPPKKSWKGGQPSGNVKLAPAPGLLYGHHRLSRPVRFEEGMDLAHSQGNPLFGLLPRVDAHLGFRREHRALHGDGVRVRRNIVRQD
jgi:hypothetical protein